MEKAGELLFAQPSLVTYLVRLSLYFTGFSVQAPS
jgi:hypothetical protein